MNTEAVLAVRLDLGGGISPAGFSIQIGNPLDQAILKQGVKQNDPST